MTLEGGCLCGAVRYRIDEDDPPFVACCCTDCQTRSGGGIGMTMPVWTTRFTVEGECLEGKRTLPVGAEAMVYSCPKCLTELYSQNSRLSADLVTVRAGTLDDPARSPNAWIWTASKQPWIAVPEDAQQYETQPDDPMVWMDIFEMRRRPQ